MSMKKDNTAWREWLISQQLIKEDVIPGWYVLSDRYRRIYSGQDDPEGEFTLADLQSKRKELVKEV